jgi:hypothetical protein
MACRRGCPVWRVIVGELGWPLLDDGRPSNKLSRATAYGVPVVSERRFLEWIGKVTPDSAHKTYSAEQLAALSKLSNDTIRELAQFGLLDERGGHFGFRDLASARQIAKLLADGVLLSEIIRSVNAIKKWLPDSGLANVRLHPGPCNSLEVELPEGRTDKHGQFVLAVDEYQHNPDELFALAVAADETGDVAEAERLYRTVIKGDPKDVAAPFNLGNMLRACGRKAEAEAPLRRGSIRPLQRLGTIFLIFWTSRDVQRPPSNAYARRCVSRLTIRTQCSTWPCCYKEKTNTRRPPIIGAAISLPMPNRNGPRGLADH